MNIVTMVQIDAARKELNEQIEKVRGMQGQGYLPCLYSAAVSRRDYLDNVVRSLLSAYHEQHSPGFLLNLLRHSRVHQPDDGYANSNWCCPCYSIKQLVAAG